MYSLLVSFCRWLQHTRLAMAILGSSWAYPVVQWTHFTGLSLWVGTNAFLDLRLLGVGKKRQTPAELSKAMFVWNWIGFAIAVTGGALLFSITATTYVRNPAFRFKLGIFIPLGLLSHVYVQKNARAWSETVDTPFLGRLAGMTELLLWLSVITAAVLIPSFAGVPE